MPMPAGAGRFLTAVAVVSVLAAGTLEAASCGPFTDVASNDLFCPSILQLYYMGVTAGASPGAFGATEPVTRQVLALMLARSMARVPAAGGTLRPALDRFWTTELATFLGMTPVGTDPRLCKSDGEDIWVANYGSSSVSRVHASTGTVLGTWTGIPQATGVLSAMGNIFVTSQTAPGQLSVILPSSPSPTPLATLGDLATGIAFDGRRIWTANAGGSVSIITVPAAITPPPWSVTTVAAGFAGPAGMVYDGTNMWVTDFTAGTLLRLDTGGAILQTVPVGVHPSFPAFDGTHIWVPNNGSDSVTVVHAGTGDVVATLTGTGIGPVSAAFDGQRILVASSSGTTTDFAVLWRAADLAPLGFGALGNSVHPAGVCSDGIDFFITLATPGQLARF